MILIPNLELFTDDSTVFIEVNLKTLPLGNMLDSLANIQECVLIVKDKNFNYSLQASIGKDHWFSKAYLGDLLYSNLQLIVKLPNNILVFNCGSSYFKPVQEPKVKVNAV